MITIHATKERAQADIQLIGEHGMRFFKPMSDAAHEWFADNLDGENSFHNGELIVEGRYADDLIEGLTEAGIIFFVPQWMDEDVPLCSSCHELLDAETGASELQCESATLRANYVCSNDVCSNCAHVCEACGHTGCVIHATNHPCPQD